MMKMITRIVYLDKGWNLFWFYQDKNESDASNLIFE